MTAEIIAYACGALFVLSLCFKGGRNFWGEIRYFMTTLELRWVRDEMYMNLYREYLGKGKPVIKRKQFNKVIHLYDVAYFRGRVLNGIDIDAEVDKHMDKLAPFFDPEYFAAHYVSPEEMKERRDASDAYTKETAPELESIRGKLSDIHDKVIARIKRGGEYSKLNTQSELLRDRQSEIYKRRQELTGACL